MNKVSKIVDGISFHEFGGQGPTLLELNRGDEKVFLSDNISPENEAMLQALYSRSPDSVVDQLKRVTAKGSSRFMESYVVGYGHKSIADCGSTTLFFEGVSLLAAKAIQDNPLYSGQETSTRYIDMSKQKIIDPIATKASQSILNRWMDFYVSSLESVTESIRSRYPKKPEEDDVKYEGAVKARTFDVLRGFLPAGITTNVSWHGNLRQMGDKLNMLTKHSSKEIARAGRSAREVLERAFPSSGFGLDLASVSGVGNAGDPKSAIDRNDWERRVAMFVMCDGSSASVGYAGSTRMISRVDQGAIDRVPFAELAMLERPKGCVLPHQFSEFGSLTFEFGLDFGSFRDIQRHRNGVCIMPTLSPSFGFEDWYLHEVGEGLRYQAMELVESQKEAIEKIPANPIDKQYLTALGFKVPCRVTYGLPALVYVLDMRSAKTVHPTLRTRVHEMISLFERKFPKVTLHVDRDPDAWTLRRATQTITERSPV